ncbi:MAG: Ig-like domain-containing protein [Candidatus Thermoplasmatota archaeon]|nr:Ig-like domain-containing protein [Candidatus Thermoplasmatota archaeon]
MNIKIVSAAMVLLMIATSGIVLFGAQEAEGVPPTRAIPRTFTGFIDNYTLANRGDFVANITAETVDPSVQPPLQIGPFFGMFNETHPALEFRISVDIQSVPAGSPWTIRINDRYGWNETGGGSISVTPYPEFYWQNGSAKTVYVLENGSSDQPAYLPGVFGNLSFTILNGSSGEPLEGVAFDFDKHKGHSTSTSGNYTDLSGNVTFRNMQLGIDQDNNVKVTFIKEHFNTVDQTGYSFFELREGVDTHHFFTLIEDPLVRSVAPADGTMNVRTEKDIVNIFVRFTDLINVSTINQNTIWLENGSGAKVPVSYTFNNDTLPSTWAYLQPIEDLEYDTDHKLVVDTGVKTTVGTSSLWRRYESSFRTWKAPGILRGTVLVEGTSNPAPEGTRIWLDGVLPRDLVDGEFVFDPVSEGVHTLKTVGPTVGGIDEYLYTGMETDPITVVRGDDIDVQDLTVTKRPTVSVIITVTDRSGIPLEGATVTHVITDAQSISDPNGRAVLSDIRASYTQQFWVRAENYQDSIVPLDVGDSDPAQFTVALSESPLPLTITARNGVEVTLDEGAVVAVNSYFVLTFEDLMNPDTMTTANIKVFDSTNDPLSLRIVNDTNNMKRWYITPVSNMMWGSDYRLWISSLVADSLGDNPLWRDVEIAFKTHPLNPASVSGRVAINDKGLEGFDVVLKNGEDTLGSAVTGPNGAFFLYIPMSVETLTGVDALVNGSEYGLLEGRRTGLTLNADEALDDVVINMVRRPNWFRVTYQVDDTGRMLRNGNITISFDRELDHTSEGFQNNFTLGSMRISVTPSADGTGVVIIPEEPLEYDTEYALTISVFSDVDYHKELRFADGKPALIRGDTVTLRTELRPLTVTLQSPSGDLLNAVAKDERFVVRFSTAVVSEVVEEEISMVRFVDDRPVGNIAFEWRDDFRALDITHENFMPETRYVIRLGSGSYGQNGAKLMEDFEVFFRSDSWTDPALRPLPSLPEGSMFASPIVVSLSNSKGYPINVWIGYRIKDTTLAPTELVNETLAALESNRQVTLDLSEVPVGVYEIRVIVRDATEGSVLNEYPLYLTIEERTPDTTRSWIIIVVVVLLLIVIIGVGAFLYLQSRKGKEEMAVREEFECPECHNTVGADDTVCPNCGAEFEEEAYKCPKCGNMLDPEDDECSECGYDFADEDKMEIDEDDYEIDEGEVEELIDMEE